MKLQLILFGVLLGFIIALFAIEKEPIKIGIVKSSEIRL